VHGDDLVSPRGPDAVCVGNAIVDWVSFVEPGTPERLGLRYGSMNLVDRAKADLIAEALPDGRQVSGGSAANTAAGIASLGGAPVFVGAVDDDQIGSGYAADLEAIGVGCALQVGGEVSYGTGRCAVLVGPNAGRTMATYLGAAVTLGPQVLAGAGIERAGVVYLEGYLFDAPMAASALAEARAIAKRAGTRLAISLSDPFVVERHHDELARLIAGVVDVLFCNEDEICALTGAADACAGADAVRREGLVAFVTCGKNGVWVVSSAERLEVPAMDVPEVVDTTGAGDLFAAGALFGLVKGASLELAASLGSLAAGEVISHAGARPEVSLAGLAREAGLLV
jgi:sugar/nucleoside kinase (ribokinase family)